jgi:hypothetical protein
VELVSRDVSAPTHLPRLAAESGMIPHELLTRLNPRIPRMVVEAAAPLGRVEQAAFRLAVRAAPDVP